MPSDKTIAVLTSGGLDSVILLHYFLNRNLSVKPVYFKSGHVWEKVELIWLKRYLKSTNSKKLKPLTILSFDAKDLYQKHWSMTGKKIPGAKSNDLKVYLPGKNLLLLSKAAVYCSLNHIHSVALGPLKTNPFPDASLAFFRALEKTCSKGLRFKFKIKTPFLGKNKNQVMKIGRDLPLDKTFSCISPRKKNHCGKCNKCAERKKAFRNAGIKDPTRYV